MGDLRIKAGGQELVVNSERTLRYDTFRGGAALGGGRVYLTQETANAYDALYTASEKAKREGKPGMTIQVVPGATDAIDEIGKFMDCLRDSAADRLTEVAGWVRGGQVEAAENSWGVGKRSK